MTRKQREHVLITTYSVKMAAADSGCSKYVVDRLDKAVEILEAVLYGEEERERAVERKVYVRGSVVALKNKIKRLADWVSKQERTNADRRVLTMLDDAWDACWV